MDALAAVSDDLALMLFGLHRDGGWRLGVDRRRGNWRVSWRRRLIGRTSGE